MPFQSEKQRRFLHANHPEIAQRWERDYANGGISQLVQPGPGRPGYAGPAGGASAGGDYGGNVNPQQEYAGRTFQETYRGDDKEPPIKKKKKKKKKNIIEDTLKTIGSKMSIHPLLDRRLHYNLALKLPGSLDRVKNYRKKYKEYLDSIGAESPSTLDDKDLFSFWQSDAFNYQPSTGMDYGAFLIDKYNNPTVTMGGNVGNFYAMEKPDWFEGSDVDWETKKRDIIEDRGYSTGEGDEQIPLWMELGFNSEDEYLASLGGQYANGGITLPKGPAGITSLNGWGSKDESQNIAGADISAAMDKNPNDPGWGGEKSGGNNGGGKLPPIVHIPKGPTAAEIAAAKAKAEAEKRRIEAAASKKYIKDFKDTQKKKVKLKSKWDTPEWVDTDKISISLEDLKPKKTLDDYYNQLDETNVPLSDWEQKHMEELENQNRLEFEDEFKKKEGISNEKLMYPPPGNLAELTDKQKKFIDKKNFAIKEGLVSPESVYKTITNPDLGVYDAGTFGFGKQEPTTIEEYNEYLQSKELPTITAVGAKGGVARKNYFHGGILDINESEEIISDDGNDIELTDYNAEFDDPNDLSTGVRTLFQAKDGGSYAMQGGVKNYLGNQEMVSAPKHWQSAPDHPETELAYITKPEKDLLVKADLHGSLHGNVNIGPKGIISLNGGDPIGGYGPGGSWNGGNQDRGPDPHDARERGLQKAREEAAKRATLKKQEAKRKEDLNKLIERGPGSPTEKYDTPEQHLADTPGDLDSKSTQYNPYKSKINVDYKRKVYEQSLAKQKAKMKKLGWMQLVPLGIMLAMGVPPSLALKAFPKTISVGPGDIATLVKYSLPAAKAKKELIAALENHKGGLLKNVNTSNPNEMLHLEETTDFTETMTQLTDLTKPRPEQDKGDDGPDVPEVVPIHEEIKTYEDMAENMGSQPMSLFGRDNKALYGALSEQWADQRAAQEQEYRDYGLLPDNPIVLNKGGLANLFRVKNQ